MNKKFIKESTTIEELDKRVNWSNEQKERIEAKANYIMMLEDLCKIKEKEKYTFSDIARKTGIPRPQVSNIFNGKRNVTIESLYRIAKAFNKQVKIKIV